MSFESMVQGRLPIVVTSAQQISADDQAIQGLVWIPSAVSQSFALYDNQNNVISAWTMAATSPIAPYILIFLYPIPCSGLSLKQITAGSTLYIYPAAV